jgi:CRISPR/Cas system CMR subunit Cmr4 (Cas7 group RAMP superfamily)
MSPVKYPTWLHPNMSDFTAPSLINWLIENLESAQDTEYVDLTEINKKYKAKATGLSVANSFKKIAHKYYHLKLQTYVNSTSILFHFYLTFVMFYSKDKYLR